MRTYADTDWEADLETALAEADREVIVGPDGTDNAAIADEGLINVDNVRVMDDGRVLCCGDADQFGRSSPNDCLYTARQRI